MKIKKIKSLHSKIKIIEENAKKETNQNEPVRVNVLEEITSNEIFVDSLKNEKGKISLALPAKETIQREPVLEDATLSEHTKKERDEEEPFIYESRANSGQKVERRIYSINANDIRQDYTPSFEVKIEDKIISRTEFLSLPPLFRRAPSENQNLFFEQRSLEKNSLSEEKKYSMEKNEGETRLRRKLPWER